MFCRFVSFQCGEGRFFHERGEFVNRHRWRQENRFCKVDGGDGGKGVGVEDVFGLIQTRQAFAERDGEVISK